MADKETSNQDPMPGMPQWEAEPKRRLTKILLIVLSVLVVAVWIILIIWLFRTEITKYAKPLEVGASLTVLLAPIIAAAAAVERMLEVIFGLIESNWRTAVAYFGRGMRWLKSAETEVIQSRQWLADVSTRYNKELSNIALDKDKSLAEAFKEKQAQIEAAQLVMTQAAQRLTQAEATLAQVTSSDDYKSAKAAAIILIGPMFGVATAIMGSLQIFAMLGISVVPVHLDVLVTGLVIGTGSNPIHSLIGVLQRAKDTLDSVSVYFKRKESPTS